MENEEKKMSCCEGKDNVKCEHGMTNCCHNWKKCHMMRKLFMLIIIVITFCLGSQWGEMKSEAFRRETKSDSDLIYDPSAGWLLLPIL